MQTTTQTKPKPKTLPEPTGTRNVQASAYGLSGRWATIVTYPAVNRGRNARGTTGSKRGWGVPSNPRHARRAKRQGADRMGNSPRLARTNPFPI